MYKYNVYVSGGRLDVSNVFRNSQLWCLPSRKVLVLIVLFVELHSFSIKFGFNEECLPLHNFLHLDVRYTGYRNPH